MKNSIKRAQKELAHSAERENFRPWGKRIFAMVAVAMMTVICAQAQRIEVMDADGHGIPLVSVLTEDGVLIGTTNLDGVLSNVRGASKVALTHVAYKPQLVTVADLPSFGGTEGGQRITMDAVDYGLDDHFGADLHTTVLPRTATGIDIDRAFQMGEAIQNGGAAHISYAVLNCGYYNPFIYGYFFTQGTGVVETTYLDSDFQDHYGSYPSIVRHYDRALCQWLTRWLADPSAMPQEESATEGLCPKRAESRLSTEAYRQKLKDAVHEYLYRVMAPILEQEEMHALWLEYESWIDSPHYRPIPRDWKWKKGKDVRHIDVRHLTWNIAKRRGMGTDKDCGYNTVVCARFIKELFPGLCRNVPETAERRSAWFEARTCSFGAGKRAFFCIAYRKSAY